MPVRTTLFTLVLAAVIWSTAPSARAATEDGRDAAKDVLSGGLRSDAPPRHPEPDRRVGDIVRNTTSYAADLVVTTRFRNLAATGFQEYSWSLLTSIDPVESWTASLVTRPGRSSGRLVLLDPIANSPDCAHATLDRPARTITLTIPASCLGNPTWVKVGNGVFFHTGTRGYQDDAGRDGRVSSEGWKYGAKVTAG